MEKYNDKKRQTITSEFEKNGGFLMWQQLAFFFHPRLPEGTISTCNL